MKVMTAADVTEQQKHATLQKENSEAEFVEDFASIPWFETAFTNRILYIKHKLLADAIATNKKEISYTVNLKEVAAPFITESPKLLDLANKCMRSALIEYFTPFGYKIVLKTDSYEFTMSWA